MVVVQKFQSAVLKTSGVECGFAVTSTVSCCGALSNGPSRAIPTTAVTAAAEREKRRARRAPSEQLIPGAATFLGAGAGSAREFRHGMMASLPRGGEAAGRCWGRSPVMGRRVAACPRGAEVCAPLRGWRAAVVPHQPSVPETGTERLGAAERQAVVGASGARAGAD